MKITKIFLISTLSIISFFVGSHFAQAEEVTGSVTVIVGANVDVKVSSVGGAKVDGPITLNTGNDVEVEWTSSLNVTSCTCTCRNPDTNVAINCGSTSSPSCGGANTLENNKLNVGPDIISKPSPIPKVVKPTKFHVYCE